jgi:hypothetical protein
MKRLSAKIGYSALNIKVTRPRASSGYYDCWVAVMRMFQTWLRIILDEEPGPFHPKSQWFRFDEFAPWIAAIAPRLKSVTQWGAANMLLIW